MHTLFIADLHLEEGRPDIAAIFLRFLQQEAAQAQALYILGDLFEVWIGDDDQSAFNLMVINALRKTVERGTKVYLMKGNRDFLIGRKFKKQSGCEILPDEYLVKLNGQSTLLMHGDTLCTLDIKYLKFRKRARNFFIQQLFLLKSLAKRKAIAQEARKRSYDHIHSAMPEIMDVTQEEVERMMKKYAVYHLIHGHTHKPNVHRFKLGNQEATRTVLAPWHEHGSVLVCHADGTQEFKILT
ncbi:MAG TPA: UDP-2,3-diacylglucosamine diphosphatase [Gammaproteobacteria bacterium]|nr:UDP-2,3-diacylglucosamine diphosphatase [Gammaproteobacteria bacterium]